MVLAAEISAGSNIALVLHLVDDMLERTTHGELTRVRAGAHPSIRGIEGLHEQVNTHAAKTLLGEGIEHAPPCFP